MDNYDASTGRTPVAYFDIDPATDLPRNPARDEYLLRFERQDGFDKEELTLAELKEGARQIIRMQSLENYATGVVSDIENLSSGAVAQFPAEHLYAVPEVDAENVRDTTDSDSGFTEAPSDKWIIKFPHKIKRINKVCRVVMYGSYTNDGQNPVFDTVALQRLYEDISRPPLISTQSATLLRSFRVRI